MGTYACIYGIQLYKAPLVSLFVATFSTSNILDLLQLSIRLFYYIRNWGFHHLILWFRLSLTSFGPMSMVL
jgi:hypothetical protein